MKKRCRSAKLVRKARKKSMRRHAKSNGSLELPRHFPCALKLCVLQYAAPSVVESMRPWIKRTLAARGFDAWMVQYVRRVKRQLHDTARESCADDFASKAPLTNLEFALRRQCCICDKTLFKKGTFHAEAFVYAHKKCIRACVTNTYYLGDRRLPHALPPDIMKVHFDSFHFHMGSFTYECVWVKEHACVFRKNTLEYVKKHYKPYARCLADIERENIAAREMQELKAMRRMEREQKALLRHQRQQLVEKQRRAARDSRIQKLQERLPELSAAVLSTLRPILQTDADDYANATRQAMGEHAYKQVFLDYLDVKLKCRTTVTRLLERLEQFGKAVLVRRQRVADFLAMNLPGSIAAELRSRASTLLADGTRSCEDVGTAMKTANGKRIVEAFFSVYSTMSASEFAQQLEQVSHDL